MRARALLLAAAFLGCANDPKPEVSQEIAKRETVAKALLLDAGAARVWAVSSRSDVLFEEGFSLQEYDPPFDFYGAPFRWMGQHCRVRLKRHGDRTMKLAVYGWADPKLLKTRPTVAVYVEGRLFGSTLALENGVWGIESLIGRDAMESTWLDLTITVSSIGFHWLDPPELKAVLLNGLTWSPQ